VAQREEAGGRRSTEESSARAQMSAAQICRRNLNFKWRLHIWSQLMRLSRPFFREYFRKIALVYDRQKKVKGEIRQFFQKTKKL